MVRFYDKVYIRPAAARITTIAKSALVSGWTLLPSGIKVTQENSMKTEADVTTPMGDGTDNVGSEVAVLDMQLINFTGDNAAGIRGALINQNVDILMYDSSQDTKAQVIFNTVVHPTEERASGKEAIIKLNGKKRYATSGLPALTEISLT